MGTELHTPHPAPPQCPMPGALVARSARPGTGSIPGVILAHGEGRSCSSPRGQGQARSRWSPWLHLPAEGFVFPPKKKKRKNKCIERSLVRRRVVVSCSTHSWRLCPGQGRCTPGCSSSVYWGGQALAPAHAWPPTPLPQNLPLGSCPAEQRPCRAFPPWVLHWLWVEAGALPAMQQLGVQESC